jgi:ankyrin repeat protein
MYSQESGIGEFFYIVNSRLRMVKSIEHPTPECFVRAVTESCGDLADFVRLVREGLNFEFRETQRREVVIFRGVEHSEAALESYREIVGKFFKWSMFSSFTEKREEAEEYGRAWRGGISVLFELRSVWCRRLRVGRTYLLHPFAVLQVEAVAGNVVKLVEVEGLGPRFVSPLPARRPPVVGDGGVTDLHGAVGCGEIRAIAKFASRPEFLNVGDEHGLTPLHVAAILGQTRAMKALVWFGADVNGPARDGTTPIYFAAFQGNESTVRVLVSLGADVNAAATGGITPIWIASRECHFSTVRVLVSLGADVNAATNDGQTPLMVASGFGGVAMVTELLKAGAAPEARLPGGLTAMGFALA